MPDDEIVWEDIKIIDSAVYDGLIFDVEDWSVLDDYNVPDDQEPRFF